MKNRAMTLVELLLALALLSALTVASVSWTTSTVRASALHGSRASWESGAARVLEQIDRMLLVEDQYLRESGRDRWRIAVENGGLLVRTRATVSAGGSVRVCATARLLIEGRVLTIEYLDGAGIVLATRPLLGEVRALAAEFEPLEDLGHRVAVRLTHQDGGIVERTWRVAREDVR